jgi:hypothetical protein
MYVSVIKIQNCVRRLRVVAAGLIVAATAGLGVAVFVQYLVESENKKLRSQVVGLFFAGSCSFQ